MNGQCLASGHEHSRSERQAQEFAVRPKKGGRDSTYMATFCLVSSASRASRSRLFRRATDSGVSNLGCKWGRGRGGTGDVPMGAGVRAAYSSRLGSGHIRAWRKQSLRLVAEDFGRADRRVSSVGGGGVSHDAKLEAVEGSRGQEDVLTYHGAAAVSAV